MEIKPGYSKIEAEKMTLEQLRRVDRVNTYAATWKAVRPISYARFAILDDKEREDCLQTAESLIKKIKDELELISRN